MPSFRVVGVCALVACCIAAYAVVLKIVTAPDGFDLLHLEEANRLEIECASGNAQSCYELGFKYRQGLGVDLDLSRAMELYQQACDGGSASGCADLGVLYQRAKASPNDRSLAAAAYDRACELGMPEACELRDRLLARGVSISEYIKAE